MHLLAFIATIILGPIAFAIWSRWVYRERETHKWPVGLADSLGDGFFIPAFNGFAFAAGFAFSYGRFALALIGVIVIAAMYYRIARSTPSNWSKTDDSRLNTGGWYHFAFLTAQSGIIIYALLSHPALIALWLMLFGFALTLIYFFFVQLPRRRFAE